ncbi:amidohydrolase [Labilibaculum euxinus]|uniref:Amidohydrolase n=1 Tax=Labilibaculum euxinus TaxID=2686357 RepID=A0A7M4D2U0_9BACT|nr:amidohydrolase [Labilibaculum euxinus]MUP36969.1 amidohydrolase [Labilibaculum euxinus]MVB06174.1 amidohydrolase [Labilibaculum euxinus]
MNKKMIALRRELHKYPEVSNGEYQTTDRIVNFINEYKPDEVIRLGDKGVLFVFKGAEQGKTVMFRCELDALPIQEISGLEYASVNKGISHVCGHDGHMAIVAGLAQKISNDRPVKGKVILLFQPAEEVEQGACDVLENVNFKNNEPDYLFALHNIPGIKKHKIVLKKGSFASGSKGMIVKLTGKTSHAAEPQDGISPAGAISQIISKLHRLRADKSLFSDFILLTIIHIQLGEISFGTSPGYAEMRITLRAFENEDLRLLTSLCEKIVKEIAELEGLACEINYTEVFPATMNSNGCVDIVEQAAKQNGLDVEHIKTPYKWSEDFGYYTEKFNACYFGLGSGNEQPQLHNPDFDFPDDIMETGINLFYTIYKSTFSHD